MPASTTATGDTAIWAADEGSSLVETRRHRMTGGVAVSLVLHVAILLLIAFDLLRFLPPPTEPTDLAIPVDLVRFGPVPAAPDVIHRAAPPQAPVPSLPPDIDRPRPSLPTPPQQAQLPPIPVPAPQPPSTPPAARQALAEAMTRKQAKAPAGKVVSQDKAAMPLAAARQPAPVDPLTLRLQQLAEQKLAATPAPPGTGNSARASGTSSVSANTATAPQTAYSARDFLRAQVIRHWNLRVEPSQGADWSVSIHLQLRRDGSVAVAEIVDPARYRLNRSYFDFAISARNAVLMSSPLTIPPGQYEKVSDIVLPFNARDAMR